MIPENEKILNDRILKNVDDLETLIDKKNAYNKAANEVIKKKKLEIKGINIALKYNDTTILNMYFEKDELITLYRK